ncbi:MAG: ComEA family DNA-binding protein, partial [Burkholderiales bacterium]
MKRFVLLLVTMLFSVLALAALNINTASKGELEALPEIGPVKAQAIIDYRNANGAFRSPEDVMKVTGIKEGTYGKIKGMISVSGSSTPLPPKESAKAA